MNFLILVWVWGKMIFTPHGISLKKMFSPALLGGLVSCQNDCGCVLALKLAVTRLGNKRFPSCMQMMLSCKQSNACMHAYVHACKDHSSDASLRTLLGNKKHAHLPLPNLCIFMFNALNSAFDSITSLSHIKHFQ